MQKFSTMLCTLAMLFGMMMAPGNALAAVTADDYTPTVTEDEVSVFLETSYDNAKIWAWNDKVGLVPTVWAIHYKPPSQPPSIRVTES